MSTQLTLKSSTAGIQTSQSTPFQQQDPESKELCTQVLGPVNIAIQTTTNSTSTSKLPTMEAKDGINVRETTLSVQQTQISMKEMVAIDDQLDYLAIIQSAEKTLGTVQSVLKSKMGVKKIVLYQPDLEAKDIENLGEGLAKICEVADVKHQEGQIDSQDLKN